MLWLAAACSDPPAAPTPAGPTTSTEPPAVPCDAPTGDLHERHLRSGGERRTYFLHVPAAYRCDTPWPALFDLHGTADGIPEEAYGLEAAIGAADDEGFLLVRPRSRSGSQGGYPIHRWDQNPGDPDVNRQFLLDLLADLQTRYALDPERVYVMGFSSGTNQTSVMAADRDTPFRGFGHVGGGAWTVDRQQPAGRFYLHTGFRDYMREYHRPLVALLDEAGVAAEERFDRRTFAGHELYDWVYPELWAFLDRGEIPADGAVAPGWRAVPGAPEGLLAVTVDADTAWFGAEDGSVVSWDGSTFAAAPVVGSPSRRETALTAICLSADGRGAAVGNGSVLWTDDAGGSWRHLDPLPEPGPPMIGYANWDGVACGAEVLAVGHWSAGITADGETWDDAILGTTWRAQAVAAAIGPTGTWMSAGYYAWLARSEDGVAWEEATGTGGAGWVYDVAPAGPDGWVAVTDGGGILRSDDDGRTFEVVERAGADLYAVAFAGDRGLAVGHAGTALASDDGGRTWRDVALGVDAMLSDVAFLADGTAIVAGDGGPWLREGSGAP